MIKTCSVCGEDRPHHSKGMCRRCYGRQYRAANKDTIKTKGKQYYKENKCRLLAGAKFYRSNHKEDTAAYNKKYYEANSENVKSRAEKWQKAHPERVKAASKQYYQDNKPRLRAMSKKWHEDNPEKARARRHERRTYLSTYADCKKINKCFIGCAAHHLDPDTIIHIPEPLHRSIRHSLRTGQCMEEMNQLSYGWLQTGEIPGAKCVQTSIWDFCGECVGEVTIQV